MERIKRDILRVADEPAKQQEGVREMPLQEVMASGREIETEKNKDVFRFDEPAGDVFQMQTGAALITRMDAEGKLRTVGLALPGDIIGRTPIPVYQWTAQTIAARGATLRALSKPAFERAVAQSPAAMSELLKNTEVQMQRAREISVIKDTIGNTHRAAAFFLWLERNPQAFDSQEESARPSFSFTASDISEVLGMTRSSFSAASAELVRDGAIARTGFAYEVLDRERLEQIAAE